MLPESGAAAGVAPCREPGSAGWPATDRSGRFARWRWTDLDSKLMPMGRLAGGVHVAGRSCCRAPENASGVVRGARRFPHRARCLGGRLSSLSGAVPVNEARRVARHISASSMTRLMPRGPSWAIRRRSRTRALDVLRLTAHLVSSTRDAGRLSCPAFTSGCRADAKGFTHPSSRWTTTAISSRGPRERASDVSRLRV